MRVERKQYGPEFKREAVRLVPDKDSAWRKPRGIWVSMRICWAVGSSSWKATASEPFPAKASPGMKNWRGCAARLRRAVAPRG